MEGQPVHGPIPEHALYGPQAEANTPQTGKASTSISMHHIPHCVKNVICMDPSLKSQQ